MQNVSLDNISLDNIYIVIKNFDTNIDFYKSLFELLGFTESFHSGEYKFICFQNSTGFTAGIAEKSEENRGTSFDRFRVGVSQLAFNTQNIENLEKILSFCKDRKVNFRFDDKIEIEKHHGVDYHTVSFFCPSGILFEFVTK
jgi:catechol 2,3-dioxygenase-like lactoylglutathione lyase family enzyme